MTEILYVSAIEEYTHCGERWRLKRAEGVSEPRVLPLIRGDAVDRSVSHNMRMKRDGKVVHRDEVEAMAYDYSQEAIANSSVVLEPGESVQRAKGRIGDQAARLAGHHHSRVAPFIEPVSIQEKITLELPDEGLPTLVGVLDLTDKQKRIRDTKTTTRKPDRNEANRSLQLTQYHLSFLEHHGEPPRALVLDNLIIYKTSAKNPAGKVEYLEQVTHRSQEEIRSYLNRVRVVYQAMKAGIAIPAESKSFKCSPRACGYWGTICQYTRGMLRD